jgi:hypothetical protein
MRLTHLFLSGLVLLASVVIGSSVHAATQMTLYINDAQSSPVAALDKFGNVLWTERYQSYGQPQDQSTASKIHPISYTTHAFDRDSQLIYMGGRYYDAKLGRFLSVDPVEFTETNVFSFNRYAYANNNPYAFSDPDGKDAVITSKLDGSMSIQIPINFSGPGATKSAISAIKQDISSRWSGSYAIGNKEISVSVSVVDAPLMGKTNSITLTTGPTSNVAAQGASFVRGGNRGEWNINSSGMNSGEAAHEAGHLMGEGDHYSSRLNADGKRVTAPNNGYVGNLMGQLPGNVNSSNLRAILNSDKNLRIKE